MKFTESEHDKISIEILKQSSDYKLINQSYKFGVASVLASLHDWCDKVDSIYRYHIITPDDIKKTFDGFMDNDDEVKAIFTRLMETDYKK